MNGRIVETPVADAWTQNGPISLPPRSLVYGAAVAVALCAVVGVGLGFQAAYRKTPGADLESGVGQAAAKDNALIAKPIVELAPPSAAPSAAGNDADDGGDDDTAKADALAAQTAAAQAIQAKSGKEAGDIDEVLASPTEKPPTATKAPEEAPPGAPVKSDVPF